MRKPLRDRVSEAVSNVPESPLGKVGDGNLLGAGGFALVESSKPAFTFVPGVKQPGYKIISHGAENVEGHERHTLKISAFSRNVARFAAQYESAPSNVDYITTETDVESIEETFSRSTYSTYEIVVNVDQRGEIE